MREGLAPGVYIGLPMEEYHRDTAVGSSGIKMLIENPYRYWYWSARNPAGPVHPDTKATKFGTAYHTLFLEPQRFKYDIKFGVKETITPGTLGEGEYKRLMAMQARVFGSPKRTGLFTGGICEVSVFWRDPLIGMMCKCRFDLFAPGWIVDLKTTTSVTDAALRYDIPDYRYDVSGYMYSLCAQVLKQMIRDGYRMPPEFSPAFIEHFLSHESQIFAFLMQEKEEPYLVRCPVLTPAVAACGRDKFEMGMRIFQQYANLDTPWPDAYPEIEDMEIEKLSDKIHYY